MFSGADGTVWAVDPVLYRITNGIAKHHDAISQEFAAPIRAATADQTGRIWAAAGNEIYILENGFHRVGTSKNLPGEVNSLLVDREGNVWAGTTAGLVCLTRETFSSLATKDGLVHDAVWSISEAQDGSLWIGTDGGISRYRQGIIENYVPKSSVLVDAHQTHVVLALKNGGVWTTPDGVICRVYPHPPEFPRGSDGRGIRERPCYEDHDGSIWMGQFGYLKRWENGELKHLFEPGAGIWSIIRDRSERLWIGTRGNGLVMIEGGKTNRITTKNGLTSDFCGPVLAEDDGTIWIASDKGLNRWKDGYITRYTVENGLKEGFVLNVLEDNIGWFWLNGHRGIYRVRKQQLNDFADGKISRVAVIAYDEADGLPSTEGNGGWIPNSCKAVDGKLWFPTTKGVAVVDPSEVETEVLAPRPLITDVTVDGETLFGDAIGLPDLKSTIQLPPGHGKIIRINYTAPAFAASARTGFEYQLENQDTKWISAKSDRFALYTNLRPGNYRFSVRSVTAEGVASEPAMFAFNVAPHFYQTLPFYAACGFCLAVLAGGIHARRLFVQRRILRLEQQTGLERERSRIAADIHDALGADFSRIAMLAERLRRGTAPDTPAADSIAQTVRRMVESMSELIWATTSRNDTLDNLISYLREHAASMCDTAGLDLHADIPSLPPRFISGFLRHNVYLIFREALNNTVKHANATEVRLRVSLTGDLLKVELSDNGRGFAPEDASRWSTGQTNLRKRAEEIKAQIDISSREGAGTSVLLRVSLAFQTSSATSVQETSVLPQSVT